MQIVPFVTDNDPYVAVFALKTPAYDHSGLSHLVEHMVFRGCSDYPASHELFITNSLLPANINATTENGFTFYYLESEVEIVFIELFKFLTAGLFQTRYSQSEFLIERDGVVYQELLMYEAIPDYENYSRAIRGSQSKCDIYNYGGFSDMLSVNDMQRLVNYKNAHYQPSAVTVFIQASGSALAELKGKLDYQQLTTEKPCKQDISHIPIPKNKLSENSLFVVSFFIHCDFYYSFKEYEYHIQQSLDLQDILVIEEDITLNGLFAVRIICKEPEKSKERLLSTIQDLSIIKRDFVYECSKQRGFVKKCIEQYLSNACQFVRSKELYDYLNTSEISHTDDIKTVNASHVIHEPVLRSSLLARQLNSYLSLDNIAPLPKFFDSLLVIENANQFRQKDHRHWLFEIEECWQPNLIEKIIEPEFWSPRLKGDCYAMGLGKHNNRLFLYGVNDIKTDSRHEFYTHYLNA